MRRTSWRSCNRLPQRTCFPHFRLLLLAHLLSSFPPPVCWVVGAPASRGSAEACSARAECEDGQEGGRETSREGAPGASQGASINSCTRVWKNTGSCLFHSVHLPSPHTAGLCSYPMTIEQTPLPNEDAPVRTLFPNKSLSLSLSLSRLAYELVELIRAARALYYHEDCLYTLPRTWLQPAGTARRRNGGTAAAALAAALLGWAGGHALARARPGDSEGPRQ